MATQTAAAVHTSSVKLEDQAATAALYHTKGSENAHQYLDSDFRLSSAGAATSLKYADARDLPSFPSLGMRAGDDSAAGIAATLGWKAKPVEGWKAPEASSAAGTAATLGWKAKPVEGWKAPEASSAASKAAMLAKDYKAPPVWQPQQSAYGAKAALLAARDPNKVELWQPEAEVRAWGNSAANIAYRSDQKKPFSPTLDYGYTAVGRQGSLLAARGAVAGARRRSGSTPTPVATYPDEANAAANARSAATHANQPSGVVHPVGGASPLVHMPREMFTSHPPVGPEVEERNREDVLHASAVAMAKRMFNIQQRQINQTADAQAAEGATVASTRSRTYSGSSDDMVPNPYTNLQTRAEELAAERLARVEAEIAAKRGPRDSYTGMFSPKPKPSLRQRMRRRASSDGSLDDDREQSRKIRAQMSIFNKKLTELETKKKAEEEAEERDRKRLYEIARGNVNAEMQEMDRDIYAQTGRASTSMKEGWQKKADAAAQKNAESRKSKDTSGKVDIGGGVFVDQSVIDAAAEAKVRPVLDRMDERAERRRIEEAERQLEMETEKRHAEDEKLREKEIKEANKRLKEQEKEVERQRKAEEKATREEQKRAQKEQKRKSREVAVARPRTPDEQPAQTVSSPDDVDERRSASVVGVEEPSHATASTEEHRSEPQRSTTAEAGPTATQPAYRAPPAMRTSMELDSERRLEEIIQEGEKDPEGNDPKGVKGWLKSKLGGSRRMSKTKKEEKGTTTKDGKEERSFVGGSALTDSPQISPSKGKEVARPAPAEETVVVEQHALVVDERPGRARRRASSVSSVSAYSEPAVATQTHLSDEEARDGFAEERLPPPGTGVFSRAAASPARDTRFHEEL